MSDPNNNGYGVPQQLQQGGGYGYPGPQHNAPAWGQQAPAPTAAAVWKSWSKRQKIIIGAAGGLGFLLVLGVASGNSNGKTTAEATPAPTVTVTVPGPTVTVTVTGAPSSAPAPEVPKPADTTTAPAAPTTGTLPNFVGQQLQASQDGAQAAGFYSLSSTDATGAGRMQVLDRHWKVCGQTPKAGTHPLTTTVSFSTVKNEEACP